MRSVPEFQSFEEFLQYYLGVQDHLRLRLDVDRKPPDIRAVTRCYQSFALDLMHARAFAELLDFATVEQKLESWAEARLEALKNLSPDITEQDVLDFHEHYPPVLSSDTKFPEAVARVLEAKHENPFVTIVAVSGVVAVLTIAGVMWACRQWRRMRTEEQVAKESVGIISAVRRAILEGDDKTVKAAEPIVTAIIKTGLASPIPGFSIEIPEAAKASVTAS